MAQLSNPAQTSRVSKTHLSVIHSTNPSLTKDVHALGLMWAAIEACSGVISACLPCLHPLFTGRSISSVLKSVSSSMNAGKRSGVDTKARKVEPWHSESEDSDGGETKSQRRESIEPV